MPSIIRFTVGPSAFLPIIQGTLAGQLDSLKRGFLMSVSLDASSDGYKGKDVININPNDHEHFVADKALSDQTRFPARMRAAATALRDLGMSGDFQITHQVGHLTVQRLFDWDFLQSNFHAEQTYLARKNGRIVCCTLQPGDNPGAPEVIMVGDKPRNIEVGEVLCGQLEPFPVFLKVDVNRWAAQGAFRYLSDTTAPDELERASARVGRPVTRIIYLARADAYNDHAGAITLDPTLDVISVVEGGRKLVQHLRRERNPQIVAAKKRKVRSETNALACECCAFDFAKEYGDSGIGFCEVHHRVPLNEAQDEVETRLEDLAVVCANCHRMLHRGPCFPTVEELRAEVQMRRRACKSLGQHA